MATQQKHEEGFVAGLLRSMVPALLLALVIRTLLFQPVNIPSGSMKPTLLVGDYLLISKFTYGYSHYSLPFAPALFSGRVFPSPPSRGDIVVFRSPTDEGTDLIKRTIGLPGDHIQVIEGALHINGTPVKRERMEDYVGEEPCQPGPVLGAVGRVKRWHETLPNGVSYQTLDCPLIAPVPDPDNTRVYTVPPGHYFMMGDNRHNSTDSRFPEVGYVPFENVIGRAQVVFFTIVEGASAWQIWRWPWAVRWGRLGRLVR